MGVALVYILIYPTFWNLDDPESVMSWDVEAVKHIRIQPALTIAPGDGTNALCVKLLLNGKGVLRNLKKCLKNPIETFDDFAHACRQATLDSTDIVDTMKIEDAINSTAGIDQEIPEFGTESGDMTSLKLTARRTYLNVLNLLRIHGWTNNGVSPSNEEWAQASILDIGGWSSNPPENK